MSYYVLLNEKQIEEEKIQIVHEIREMKSLRNLKDSNPDNKEKPAKPLSKDSQGRNLRDLLKEKIILLEGVKTV